MAKENLSHHQDIEDTNGMVASGSSKKDKKDGGCSLLWTFVAIVAIISALAIAFALI